MIRKKFELLMDLHQTRPEIRFDRCSALLPNRMQCVKGADFLVTEVVPVSLNNPQGERSYQLCRQHAVLEEKEMVQKNEKEKMDAAANPNSAAPTPVATFKGPVAGMGPKTTPPSVPPPSTAAAIKNVVSQTPMLGAKKVAEPKKG